MKNLQSNHSELAEDFPISIKIKMIADWSPLLQGTNCNIGFLGNFYRVWNSGPHK